MKNSKLFIGVITVIILVAILHNQEKPGTQIVADVECFEKLDCKVDIPPEYCGVEYDCVAGKCYHDFTICPEICGSGIDEDIDGLRDCDDPDCWNNIACHCRKMTYNTCMVNRCYCPVGMKPQWVVLDESSWCDCFTQGG